MQFYEEEKYLFEGEIFNKEKSKLKINFERKNELFKKGRLLK